MTKASDTWKLIEPYVAKFIDKLFFDKGGAAEPGDDNYFIYLYTNGAEILKYSFTEAGFNGALTAANANDLILLPPGTLASNHNINVAEVRGVGIGKTILSGTITNNSTISNLTLSGTVTNNGYLYGVTNGTINFIFGDRTSAGSRGVVFGQENSAASYGITTGIDNDILTTNGYTACFGQGNAEATGSSYNLINGLSNTISNAASYGIINGSAQTLNGTSYSSILSGNECSITGSDYAVAAGRRAIIANTHSGAFVFADSNDFDFTSIVANEFAVRAIGGARFVVSISGAGAVVNYVYLDTTGGITGGHGHTITSTTSSIAIGEDHVLTAAARSAIFGQLNTITSAETCLIAGYNHTINTVSSFVTNEYNVVSGGYNNVMGYDNIVSGWNCTLLSGWESNISGDKVLAGGIRIIATHDGVTMFSDSTDSDFDSAVNNEFACRFTGGYRFVTAVDGSGDPTVSTTIAASGNITTPGTITATASGYGEMYMYDNVTACVIDTTNVYHAVYNTFGNNDGTLAPTRDTNYWTYKAGVGYTITAFADYSGTVAGTTQVTTSATHALLAGEPITITGTTNYNAAFLVTGVIDATNFYITKVFAGDDATGSVRRPATMKALVAGVYKATFDVSGTPANPNDNLKFELNKDVTPLDNIVARGIWTSATKYQSMASSGFVSVTAGQYIWLSVKNYSGTGNLTISSGNVVLNTA